MNAKRPAAAAKPAKAKQDAAKPDGGESGGERIAKRLARAGLCSRRDAERWIAEGRVAVNGTVLASPACVVRPGDAVLVDGAPIPEPEPARLWRYHKPSGLVTTARDEKGRETVFEKLPPELPRVVSVGRLDLTTEGLLLLTNDGELARFLELPSTGWTRRYRVRVFGEVDENQLAKLEKGLTIDGVQYGPIEAALDRIQGRNAWLTVALKEGKNREIRKVMETLGLQVNRLIRVAYGPFQLGKLEEGSVEEVPRRVVKEQLARFFADREDEEVKAPSKTQQRARARAEGQAGPVAVSQPAAVAKVRSVVQQASPSRAPRTAARRQEAQAAWGKDETTDGKRRTAGKAASVKGTSARTAPADGGPKRGREQQPVAKAAAKSGSGKPLSGKPAFDKAAQGIPAAARPGVKPSGRAPAKPAAAPRNERPAAGGPRTGGGPKPATTKPTGGKPGNAKPGNPKPGGPRADRRR